jgi:hypothetical protein
MIRINSASTGLPAADKMPLTIYIPLQGEGTEAWRLVEAEHVGNDRCRMKC